MLQKYENFSVCAKFPQLICKIRAFPVLNHRKFAVNKCGNLRKSRQFTL